MNLVSVVFSGEHSETLGYGLDGGFSQEKGKCTADDKCGRRVYAMHAAFPISWQISSVHAGAPSQATSVPSMCRAPSVDQVGCAHNGSDGTTLSRNTVPLHPPA